MSRVLRHAAQIVGAGRALVAWEAGDEPWLHLARGRRRASRSRGMAPDEFGPIVPAELADVVVLRTAAIGTHSSSSARPGRTSNGTGCLHTPAWCGFSKAPA